MVTYHGPIDRSYQYLLIAALFLLPLTVLGNNIAIWLITIIWLCSGNYIEKFQKIKNNKLALASIAFFLIHLLGLLWTENLYWGLEIVRKMLPFLLVLPIFLSISKIENSNYYIGAFLLAIVVSQGISYLIWFGIIFTLMIECALITPPVGLNIYVLQAIGKAKMSEIAKGVIPFVIIFLFTVFVIYLFPDIALYIPFKL